MRIKIGTRESELALWQAKHVQALLLQQNIQSELVLIKSAGEKDLNSPLYEMGVQGIFTKTLDVALLKGEIDIAVHSLKDVPTQVAKGIEIAAVPKRGPHKDCLVFKEQLPEKDKPYLVATGSLRRAAQWFNKFPDHKSTVLRGNINTRLQKLQDHAHWHGALFAEAGVERIGLKVPNKVELDWMIPAPSQGALGIAIRESDQELKEKCALLSHHETQISTQFERTFLRKLEGGCSMPIGGFAHVAGKELKFTGVVLTVDGKHKSSVTVSGGVDRFDELMQEAVGGILENDGADIVKSFKNKF